MNRISLIHLGSLALVCGLSAGPVGAEDTRADAASKQRDAKEEASSSASVPQRRLFERVFTWAIDKIDPAAGADDGVYPDLDGPIPGSGWPSAGAGYRHHLFGDRAVLDGSASISPRRYSALQSTIQWPQLFSNRLSIAAQIKYQDFTQINYFGIGPETAKSAQTDYRLKNVDLTTSATLHPREWLALGGRAGYLRGAGVEPGLSSIYPSTHERFDESSAPGLTGQSRFAHGDAFVETDGRDVPGYPTRGGIYRLGLATFQDLDGSGHSFRRFDLDATQYVPLFHQNWIVAVRSRVTLSQTAAGNDVPFYLLPTLGGGNTLRGYSDYRFRDRDTALFSAEYRWPVFGMMDGALFVDAGSVAATAADLRRARLHQDYGFGLRLHSETKSIARIDVAKGQEGIRVAVSLSAPFGASRNVTPYVP
jgi:outer membrane protein assembly factor BamA